MLGQLLDGRYQIQQTLGAGGFGQTYLAIDTRRPGQPLCVVKHLKPASNDAQTLQTARRLFNSEAEILEKLGQHPQIPRLLAYFEQAGEFYLVQDYIDGHSLSAELSEGDRWTEREVSALLNDVLPILEFVHSRGAIHRDLKPDNLLRQRSDNHLVLIDFGAVKRLRTEPAENQTVAIGTPGYMASEQAQGQPCFGSDLYALGAIALQALTGTPPSKFEYNPHTGEIVWDRRLCSPPLAQILSRLVAYHFRDRYASARDARADLAALDATSPPTSVPPTPAAPATAATPLSQQATYAVPGARRPPTQTAAPTAATPAKTSAPRIARPLPLLLLFATTSLVAFSVVFAAVYTLRNRAPETARSPAPSSEPEPEQPGWGRSWWESINDSFQSVRSAFARDGGRCTVLAANGINVRAQPSLEAERVGGAENGEVLELSGAQDNDWLEVREPIAGWVYHDPQLVACTGLPEPDIAESPLPELEPEVADEPATPRRDRGSDLLADAQRRLESGDLSSALDLARSIPEISNTYNEAQQAIDTWQREWDRAQQAYNRAQEALDAGRWNDAIAHANSVVQNPYWRERLQQIAERARQRQAAQQQRQPAPSPSPSPQSQRPAPPSPSPSPSPSPKPSPQPTPSPRPVPSLSPMPVPSPRATPQPSPTLSPREPRRSPTEERSPSPDPAAPPSPDAAP